MEIRWEKTLSITSRLSQSSFTLASHPGRLPISNDGTPSRSTFRIAKNRRKSRTSRRSWRSRVRMVTGVSFVADSLTPLPAYPHSSQDGISHLQLND